MIKEIQLVEIQCHVILIRLRAPKMSEHRNLELEKPLGSALQMWCMSKTAHLRQKRTE